MIFTNAARHTPVGLTSAVSPQPLGPGVTSVAWERAPNARSPESGLTYTIFQPLQTTHN